MHLCDEFLTAELIADAPYLFQVLHRLKDSDTDYGISPAADAGKPVEY
jgi:hypothetical protein